MKISLLFCTGLIPFFAGITHAQTPVSTPAQTAATATQSKTLIEELDWIDKKHLDQQELAINELTQKKLGISIKRDLKDLDTLQRIIDTKLVASDDYKTLQAMGIVLGNIMQADFPHTLEWKAYSDELGRSRALCVRNTANCLFPVTMLERRITSGTHPEVKKIYQDAILSMEKHLPQLPYGGGIMYRLPR